MALGEWTSTFQAERTDSSTIGTTDDAENQHRRFVQERGVVEHDWGTSSLGGGLSDTGRHKPGSARAFWQDAAPTRLRLFDNSGDDPGGAALLGTDDTGRFWVDTNGGNKLWAWNGTAFEEVSAAATWPSPVNTVSVDATALTDSGYTVLGGWGATLQIVLPAEGTWRVFAHAQVYIVNGTGGNDRLARVELRRDGALAEIEEQTVRRNDGGSDGHRRFELWDFFAGVAGTTYTWSVQARAWTGSGSNVTYGGGAPRITGDAINRNHRFRAWAVPAG